MAMGRPYGTDPSVVTGTEPIPSGVSAAGGSLWIVAEDQRSVDVVGWDGPWEADDPDANFKAEVACYTAADPLPTLENLSAGTGIPVECLIRYVLVKYAASASEALMAMDPIVFQQMREHIARAEQDGSDEARLKAYMALKDMISWLGMD